MFSIGRVEDTMVLISERRQIEDLIATILYAEFRLELARARLPTLMITIDPSVASEAAPTRYLAGAVLLNQARRSLIS